MNKINISNCVYLLNKEEIDKTDIEYHALERRIYNREIEHVDKILSPLFIKFKKSDLSININKCGENITLNFVDMIEDLNIKFNNIKPIYKALGMLVFDIDENCNIKQSKRTSDYISSINGVENKNELINLLLGKLLKITGELNKFYFIEISK